MKLLDFLKLQLEDNGFFGLKIDWFLLIVAVLSLWCCDNNSSSLSNEIAVSHKNPSHSISNPEDGDIVTGVSTQDSCGQKINSLCTFVISSNQSHSNSTVMQMASEFIDQTAQACNKETTIIKQSLQSFLDQIGGGQTTSDQQISGCVSAL